MITVQANQLSGKRYGGQYESAVWVRGFIRFCRLLNGHTKGDGDELGWNRFACLKFRPILVSLPIEIYHKYSPFPTLLFLEKCASLFKKTLTKAVR